MYLIDTCTSTASASSSTGCRSTSRPTTGPRATSTARTCTSTPTRRQGFHPDWGSYVFNYGRHEVRSFLLSSARCSGSTSTTSTACASMRSRRCSTSTTRARTASGSRTSTAARRTSTRSTFLRRFNEEVYTALPGRADVSRRNRPRGRWCRGRRTSAASASATSGTWAGCTTRCSTSPYDPIHRKYHQNDLTFRMLYAYNENFVLPLSHDEVVHGKGPLWDKMAGRRVAEVRRPAAALRLPVGDDRQEAAVHGRRDRPAAGVAARRRASTGTCLQVRRRTRACSSWSAT